jgi:acetylornithine deacetylase/succinyl-diaminopimelate desuccinylase-like protein
MGEAASLEFVGSVWDEAIVPALTEYIRIPNKSPAFDPVWRAHGHMHRAVALIADWCRRQPIEGLKVEVIEHENRTPVIWAEVPGSGARAGETVLLYGHLDKQPEMTGWAQGLGPWEPVRRGDRLYGRGGADDGYAAFASLTAIAALKKAQLPHARIVMLIEATEESGSPDLPYYVQALSERLGSPGLVVCLDSGCGNYEQLWCTTSLRGIITGTLTVRVLTEGVHSGDAGGIVPSSFRIARQLLSRIEAADTGEILLPAFHGEIPGARRAQARVAAGALGPGIWKKFPFAGGTQPATRDDVEAILARTWRPALAVTGASGLPPAASAGNVLRPFTALQLALRVPPRVDANAALRELKQALEATPPHGAQVTFEGDGASGWDAPALAPWLETALEQASQRHFGKPALSMGEGGSIPFMGMLGERFPEAQFMITGVLGPESNAHGPNEFLHIPTGKRLTACVADVIAAHAAR